MRNKLNLFLSFMVIAGILAVLQSQGYLWPIHSQGQSNITSPPVVSLNCTTPSIGGGALLIGGSATGTCSVPGAIAGQPCVAAASDGTNIAGLGVDINCVVTANGTATVTIVAIVALTPTAKTYNVKVPM